MHAHHLLRLWFFSFVGVSIVLEIVWYLLLTKRSYPWHEMLASAGVYLLRMPAKALRPILVAPLAFFLWSHRVATVPFDGAGGLALLFLSEEFAYYWMHRSAHKIRWMWASHVVHHTPEQIHFASAYRLGVTEFLSGNWLFHLPLYVLGFNPLAVAGMSALNLFYQFWLHTDIVGRLGPFEWIFNTPSHHRVHHASNPEYIDRNYGGILIIWDRIFGTFARENSQTQIVYGLVHPVGSLNPLKLSFHEWIAIGRDVAHAQSWRERFTQLFGRPGDSRTIRALECTKVAIAAPAE